MSAIPDMDVPVRNWEAIQTQLDALRNAPLPDEQKAALLPIILALETNIDSAKTEVINHMLRFRDFLNTTQDSLQNTRRVIELLMAREKESTIRLNKAVIGPFVVTVDADKVIVCKTGVNVFSYQRGEVGATSCDRDSLVILKPVIDFILVHEKILNSKNRLIVQSAQHASLLLCKTD